MSDQYHSGERFTVVRDADDCFAVIDQQHSNLRYSRHYTSNAAHKHADELNAQHRAERDAQA